MAVSLFDEPVKPLDVILRPYQENAVGAILAGIDRGINRGLIVMATGTGKTTVFSSLIRRLSETDPAFTGLVLAHRKELLRQAAVRIEGMNPHLSVAIESGESTAPRGSSVVVGSVQALGLGQSKRLDWLAPSLVIVDEAHHAAADTYQNVLRRMNCYDERSGVFTLGVTATPHRLDNKALHGTEQAIFEEVLYAFDIVAAIKDGWLADLRGYRAQADIGLDQVRTVAGDYNAKQLEAAVNVDPVNELAFKSWSEVARDRQTIVFCAGVDHARRVCEIFQAQGVSAAFVCGETPAAERDAIFDGFQRGEIQVLTNMDIATEGFDAPDVGCIVLLRPTKSWSLFVQMIGRGLRVLPNTVEHLPDATQRREAVKTSAKPDCIVIDIVDNTGAHSVGQTPESQNIPSLQAVVGLPSALDLEGRTLAEAVSEFDLLPEEVKAAAFRRETSFRGLSAALTQVEMLSELEVPPEAVEAGAQLFWMRTSDLTYVIDCGQTDRENIRTALMVGDILGNWSLHLKSTARNEQHGLPSGVERPPFEVAERIIRKSFFGVARFADRNAAWRKGSPTSTQVAFLKRHGVGDEIIGRLNKGTASAMMTRIQRQQQGEL